MGAKKFNKFVDGVYITKKGTFIKSEIEEYYKTHNRQETAEHFNVSDRYMKLLISELNIIKSNEDIKNQIEQGFIKKYGVKRPFQSKEIQDKIISNLIEKYGVNNQFQREEIKEKIKLDNLLKYDVEYSFQRPEIQKKYKQTCLNKYGVENISQTSEFHKKCRKRYEYEGEKFDSLPELALWVYAKHHNEYIEREPIKLEFEYEGKKHYTFPDFRYNGKLIEIKGDHFFKEDGTMCNPFDHSQDGLYEAKHQCELNNGVEFWTQKDYKFALEYLISVEDI